MTAPRQVILLIASNSTSETDLKITFTLTYANAYPLSATLLAGPTSAFSGTLARTSRFGRVRRKQRQ